AVEDKAESDFFAFRDCEVGEMAEIARLDRHRRPEVGGLGSGEGTEATLRAPDPWESVAVVEPQGQVHSHGHGAALAAEETEDGIGGSAIGLHRHAINKV